MKKEIKISIAEPCHENWNEMSAQEKGRFCDVCSKCVFDFTQKSKEEILEVYQENQGNVCGRFRQEQVEANQPLPQPVPLGKSSSFQPLRPLQVFAAALLLVFGLGAAVPAYGQTHYLGKMAVVERGEIRLSILGLGLGALPEVKVASFEGPISLDRVQVSQEGSELRFEGLPYGPYRMELIVPGYLPTWVEVDVQGKATAEVRFQDEEPSELIMPLGEPVIEEVEVMEMEVVEYAELEEEIAIDDVLMGDVAIEAVVIPEELMVKGDTVIVVEEVEKRPVPEDPKLCNPMVLGNMEVIYTEEEIEEPLAPEPVGIAMPKLEVNPNPATDQINYTLRTDQGGKLVLTDLQGHVLLTRKLRGEGPWEGSLPCDGLSHGIYVLSFQNEVEAVSTKIVVNRP